MWMFSSLYSILAVSIEEGNHLLEVVERCSCVEVDDGG